MSPLAINALAAATHVDPALERPSDDTATSAAPPATVIAIAGDAKAWLLYPQHPNPKARFQYRLDDGAWRNVASSSLPYLIGGLTNGVAVSIEVRAVIGDLTGPPSAPATAIPSGSEPAATP
jgi:hypothetical protein